VSPFIQTKDYNQIISLNFGYGSDEKGNLCVVIAINGKIYLASVEACNDIIKGIQEALKAKES
jgi:hypothetical protein